MSALPNPLAQEDAAVREASGRTRSRLGGVVLVVVGAAFFWQALDLPLGTMHRMGPGLFPLFVSVAVALLGLTLVVAAPPIPDGFLTLAKRPLAFISLAALSFAFLVGSTGLVPASFVAVLLAALSEERQSSLEPILLAATSAVFAWVLFSWMLGLPLKAFGS